MDGKGNGIKSKRMREHQSKPARGGGEKRRKKCTPKRKNRHTQVPTTRIAIAEQEERKAEQQGKRNQLVSGKQQLIQNQV